MTTNTLTGRLRAALPALALALTPWVEVAAQCPRVELLPDEVAAQGAGAWFVGFGNALAFEGDALWAGAPGFDLLYRLSDTGVVTGQLTSPDATGSSLGTSLVAEPDVVVTGGPEADGDRGAVWAYAFDGTSWSRQRLDPPVGDDVLAFGASLALDGDTLAVGATGLLPGSEEQRTGRVYVYERIAGVWTLEQTLASPVGGTGFDGFGWALALDGDRLYATAVSDPGTSGSTGRLHVFERTAGAWAPVSEIVNPEPLTPDQAGNTLGSRLALDGGDVLLSHGRLGPAFSDDLNVLSRSSVDVYRETSPGVWVLAQQLESGVLGDAFGVAITVRGDRLVVGAPGQGEVLSEGFFPDITTAWGRLYAYTREPSGWQLERTVDPPRLVDYQQFGAVVAIDDARWAVGSFQIWYPGEPFPEVVGVQLYDASALDFVGPWSDLGGALAGGAGAPLLSGGAQLCQGQPLAFDVAEAAPAATAWLVVGLDEGFTPFRGGVLVPTPDLVVGPFVTDGLGGLAIQDPVASPVPPGTTLVIQAWIEDVGAPAGWAATNGLRGDAAP